MCVCVCGGGGLAELETRATTCKYFRKDRQTHATRAAHVCELYSCVCLSYVFRAFASLCFCARKLCCCCLMLVASTHKCFYRQSASLSHSFTRPLAPPRSHVSDDLRRTRHATITRTRRMWPLYAMLSRRIKVLRPTRTKRHTNNILLRRRLSVRRARSSTDDVRM